jgi:hypothetical protein
MQRHQEASHLASLVQDVSACGLDVLLVVIGPITSVTTAGHAEADHAEAGCHLIRRLPASNSEVVNQAVAGGDGGSQDDVACLWRCW